MFIVICNVCLFSFYIVVYFHLYSYFSFIFYCVFYIIFNSILVCGISMSSLFLVLVCFYFIVIFFVL